MQSKTDPSFVPNEETPLKQRPRPPEGQQVLKFPKRQRPKIRVIVTFNKLREFVVVGIMWVPAEMQKLLVM